MPIKRYGIDEYGGVCTPPEASLRAPPPEESTRQISTSFSVRLKNANQALFLDQAGEKPLGETVREAPVSPFSETGFTSMEPLKGRLALATD